MCMSEPASGASNFLSKSLSIKQKGKENWKQYMYSPFQSHFALFHVLEISLMQKPMY